MAMLGQKPTVPLCGPGRAPAGSAPKSPQLHSIAAIDRATADQAVVAPTGGQGVFAGLESTTERRA